MNKNDGSFFPTVGQYDNLTHTTLSTGLPCISGGTDAHVCTDQVLAGHASAGTVVYTIFTLILIWNTNSVQTA